MHNLIIFDKTGKLMRLITAIFLIVAGVVFSGQIIDFSEYSVIASSTSSYDRAAGYVIDGSGLSDPLGDIGIMHSGSVNPSGYAWHTDYNGGGSANGIVEHAWVIFDLGEIHTLDSMNVWNYNHRGNGGQETTRSIRTYNVWVRTDDSAGSNMADSDQPFNPTGWTLVVENGMLQPGPGLGTYTGELISFGAVHAQRVAIEVLSNYDGFDVTGDGIADTDPYGPLAGCSEVRFFETYGPIRLTETEGQTQVSEDGTVIDGYTLELLQAPLSDVTVILEEVSGPNQLVVVPKTLTFTAENWQTSRHVSVSAIDDSSLEAGLHHSDISHQLVSSDPDFDEIIFPLSVSILENDCGAWGFDPVDLNFDCYVNLEDMAMMLSRWLACSVPNATGCENLLSQSAGVIIPTADELPPIEPLIDTPMRDICILLGPDGMYYMTGTTGYPDWWTWNNGIHMFKSSDLVNWELMDQPGDNDGLIWNINTEGTWANEWKNGKRAVWAPEIHYINGTYWLAYCVNWPGGVTGLLKSTTGLPEGPYVDVKTDGPLTTQIDASLFQDDDGTVYFIWQEGNIWQMNEQMDGFVGNMHELQSLSTYSEGAFMRKINGRYYLGSTSNTGRYDFAIVSSDSVFGPFADRYIAIPHAGHNVIFHDADGRMYSTIFGFDGTASLYERAAMLPIKMDENGRIVQTVNTAASAIYSWRYTTTAPQSAGWTMLGFDDTNWTSGSGGFGLISTSYSIPRTQWDSSDIWMRRKFELDSPWQIYSNLTLKVFHTGDTEIYLNNQLIAELTGSTAGYIQISLGPEVSQDLLVGTNVLSVHCSASDSNRYVDVGLYYGE